MISLLDGGFPARSWMTNGAKVTLRIALSWLINSK